MPGPFTHKKLTEVEDSAPGFGMGDLQEARFANDDLEAQETGVSHHRLRPNKRHGIAHRHDDAEEVYVVLAGSGRMKLDDEIVEVEVLDAIRVSPTVTRQFEAGSEGMEWIVFGPQRDGDGAIVEDFWTD